LVDPGVRPNRRCRRPLLAGCHVPVDEPHDVFAEIVIGVAGPARVYD
jgi:hypothetical protein